MKQNKKVPAFGFRRRSHRLIIESFIYFFFTHSKGPNGECCHWLMGSAAVFCVFYQQLPVTAGRNRK